MPTSADVPGKFDLVLNGQGYILSNTVDQSLPFRTQRASYSSTPTFLERTNVGASYGDDQQAFYMTVSQNDWEGGEGQRFFDPDDVDKKTRYLKGSAADTATNPGVVDIRDDVSSVSSIQTVKCMTAAGETIGATKILGAGSTNLWMSTKSIGGGPAAFADQGAHGAGTPNYWGACQDGVYVYISGASKIRKWTGAAYSDFASVGNNGSIAYLNNTLYTCDGSVLASWSGTGVKTTVFTWKDATNTAYTSLARTPKILPVGGKLYVYFPQRGGRPEVWQYDGTGTTIIAALPPGAIGYDIAELNGLVYLSAALVDASLNAVPTVYELNGDHDLLRLWTGYQGSSTADIGPALDSLNGKLLIHDRTSTNSLIEYDPGTGSFTNITTSAAAVGTHPMVCCSSQHAWLAWDSANNGYTYPSDSAAASAYVILSAFDFKNSRKKNFSGVTVDWTGSGSVNIKYAVDPGASLQAATFSTLQTTAVSGTEYTFPTSTIGKTLLVKVELVTAVGSPTLTRVYVRAAPLLQQYKLREYVLDLSGRDGKTMVRLRDGTDHTLDGMDMATNLNTAATATAPVSITDRFGTFTGIIEPDKYELIEVRPDEFLARVQVREV